MSAVSVGCHYTHVGSCWSVTTRRLVLLAHLSRDTALSAVKAVRQRQADIYLLLFVRPHRPYYLYVDLPVTVVSMSIGLAAFAGLASREACKSG